MTFSCKKVKNMESIKKWGLSIAIIIASLLIISLIVTFFANQPFLASLRIVYGSVYVLFLPGFLISYIFFPKTRPFDEEEKEKGSIDWIERIALSFALSIAIVPLAVFYLNLIGLKINLLNSFLTILGILIISLVILILRRKN
jgi:uncharacterized membrane protein